MEKSLEQIYCKFKVCGKVTTDSRRIEKNSIFFALKGSNFDGNQFALKAIEEGACMAVVDDRSVVGDNIVHVEDVLKTLQQLASWYRKDLKIPVVGLTGTNGKTTTKELIVKVLSKKYEVSATKGNLNNQIGVPLTILAIPNSCEIAIVEMGANHPGDIEELVYISQPNFGLITNVGRAHLEGFGSFEGVKKTKGELYDYLNKFNGKLFLNSDNHHLKEMAQQRGITTFVTYGMGEMGVEILEKDLDNPFLRLRIGKGSLSGLEINTKIVGDYNIDNVLAALSVGLNFGVSTPQMKEAIEEYAPENIRSQLIRTKENLVVADCYNANPTSMDAALNNFSSYNIKNKVAILGDMKELGNDSFIEHEKVLKLALSLGIQSILLVGTEFSKIKLNDGCKHFNDVEGLMSYLEKNPIKSSLVLVKGSRGIRLESSLPLL